jgi:uncharacterized membrane protein
MASVTMQYSMRPSPLSLDRVAEGRTHYRMLVDAIHNALGERPPEKRPRMVLFGESLGAWTSQDAFAHRGTQGRRAGPARRRTGAQTATGRGQGPG